MSGSSKKAPGVKYIEYTIPSEIKRRSLELNERKENDILSNKEENNVNLDNLNMTFSNNNINDETSNENVLPSIEEEFKKKEEDNNYKLEHFFTPSKKSAIQRIQVINTSRSALKREKVLTASQVDINTVDPSSDSFISDFSLYLKKNKLSIVSNEPFELDEASSNVFFSYKFWQFFIQYLFIQNKEKTIPIMKLIVLITKCLSYTNNEEEGKEPFTLYINKLLKEKYSKEDREKYDDAIKSFYQFNNKDILNSKNKKMCVTKEEVDEYRYELVLRNKYDLVVKNEGRFAYGTTKRNKEFFDESKVVIENIPSFSMKGSTNDKSENEEIIDTSTSSCANKRKTSRNQSKKKEKIEDKESEEEEEDHKKKEDNKKKAGSKRAKSINKKKKKK